MRDCENEKDALEKCSRLLPYDPDINTRHMESWEITEVYETATGKTYIETQEC
jgi:hypothetical protein